MKRFSSGVMWGALLFFALGYFLVLVGRGEGSYNPKVHMALTDPGHNGAILLEMWCDELTVDHNDNAVYCWHSGVAVLKVPHSTNFAWAPLEAK